MSYDIYMKVEPCKTCGHQVDPLDINVTWNLSPMFIKALKAENGINSLHTASGGNCLRVLDLAIQRMEKDFKEYEEMNPPNGWGDAKGALKTLKIILKICEKHRDGIIYIS